jgi:hypothetical protein
MTGFSRNLPWVVVGLGVLFLAVAMVPPADEPGEMNLTGFGSLPVIDRGRVKPIDTYARTQLMLISNRQEYTDETGKRGQPATRWLLNLLAEGLARWYNRIPSPTRKCKRGSTCRRAASRCTPSPRSATASALKQRTWRSCCTPPTSAPW